MCGYRPNMTRRPESVLVYSFQGNKCYFDYAESVALDIAMNLAQGSAPRIDDLIPGVFINLQLFTSAHYFNTHLAIHLVARCCYGYEKDTMNLITETLRVFYKTITSWNNNAEYANSCAKVNLLWIGYHIVLFFNTQPKLRYTFFHIDTRCDSSDSRQIPKGTYYGYFDMSRKDRPRY